VVEQIAVSLKTSVRQIIQEPQLLEKVDRSQLAAGSFTVDDILAELRRPGRDPRDKFVAPSFDEGVREIADVVPGMVLEGVVTNVTKFGAFVDIGVHQDGLVHISELSNRFIQEPSEAVKTGQIVKVKVLGVDLKAKRIALSIKQLTAPAARPTAQPAGPAAHSAAKSAQAAARSEKPAARSEKSTPRPQPTMEEKLAALSTKWKVR
jgi:uncharacterized protein